MLLVTGDWFPAGRCRLMAARQPRPAVVRRASDDRRRSDWRPWDADRSVSGPDDDSTGRRWNAAAGCQLPWLLGSVCRQRLLPRFCQSRFLFFFVLFTIISHHAIAESFRVSFVKGLFRDNLSHFYCNGSYMTDKEQNISWHSFLRHSVYICLTCPHYAKLVSQKRNVTKSNLMHVSRGKGNSPNILNSSGHWCLVRHEIRNTRRWPTKL